MEIVVCDSPGIEPLTVQRLLAAEGHRVSIRRPEADVSCDLVVLDADTWTDESIAQLVRRSPSTELLFLVDSLDARLPTDAAIALLKPVDPNKLIRLVRVVAESRSGAADPRELVDFETLFSGDSPAIIELLRKVGLVAQSDAPVWLHGELGSGRAVVARAIHDRSARAGRIC